MTFETLLSTLSHPDIMLPLFCSMIAGALIGAEREFQGKPAGLRTHMLVCFASALMTLAALRMGAWTAYLPEGVQVVSDMSRMPHAILTGIGFLGAGVIFREGMSVQGLTTAASLWLTAAIGITFGTGLLELATISTVIALCVLFFLRIAQRLAPPRPELSLDLSVMAESDFDLTRITSLLSHHNLSAKAPSLGQDRATGTRRYHLLVAATQKEFDIERLAQALSKETAVTEFTLTQLGDGAVSLGKS